MIVFGGLTTIWQEFVGLAPEPVVVEQPQVSSTLLRYDIANEYWHTLTPRGRLHPLGRFRHTATLLPSQQAMAVWGGFTVWPTGAGQDGVQQPGWDERCSAELFLLDLASISWSEPTCRGIPALPRGGHSAVMIGDYLVILGGCDGGEEAEDPAAEADFVERDLNDMRALNTSTWQYVEMSACGVDLPPRSGHTAHLLPCDGGVALLVLGGRDYRPPEAPWQDGQHLGRDDAFLLLL